MRHFKRLIHRYGNVVDFAVVYIEEAHADDEWHVGGSNIRISSHRTLEDRVQAAGKLESLVQERGQGREEEEGSDACCPILIDPLSNWANVTYGAMFERLYVLQRDTEGHVRVAFQGGRGPSEYRMSDVDDWLQTRFGHEAR